MLFGDFAVEGCKFSYRYTNASLFIESGSGTTASRKPPWEGMRVFAVTAAGANTILRTADGKAEFSFSASGLRYSENGKLARVWKKITQK